MKQQIQILLFAFLLFFVIKSYGQYCGTPSPNGIYKIQYDEAERELGGKEYKLVTPGQAAFEKELIYSLQFWIINGNKEIDDENIESSLNRLNVAFNGAKIQFEQHKQPKYFNDKHLTTLSDDDELYVYRKYNTKKVINIYLVANIELNTGDAFKDYSGYTYLPDASRPKHQQNVIFLTFESIKETSTLAHEMGHFFGLLHTHEDNDGKNPELVRRVNCRQTGDCLCDTPADPGLVGAIDTYSASGCTYTGKKRDKEGRLYQPDVNNIMSYSYTNCRIKLSKGQYRLMRVKAVFERSDLRARKTAQHAFGEACFELFHDLGMAKENFKYGGASKSIIFVYQDSMQWCNRMADELMNSPEYLPFCSDYSLVLFEGEQTLPEIIDFLDNETFKLNQTDDEMYAFLKISLTQGVNHYPSIYVVEYFHHTTDSYYNHPTSIFEDFNLGYMKPRELIQLLKLDERISSN